MGRLELRRRDALQALLREVRRPRSEATRGLPPVGHFAGLVRAGGQLLALTTDTVGTKVILAEQFDGWEQVGEDLVTVNTNDLAAVGARPLGLVDTLSIPSADPVTFRMIGRGINRGLRAAGCALLGGETAIVPELIRHMDLGATAIGHFPGRRGPVTGASVQPGDIVVGIAAHGFHSNGYTLIRRVLRTRPANLARSRPGADRSLADELLEPTRCYVPAVESVAGLAGVHGFAHISGGGVRNLVRIRPRVRFVLDGWPAPSGLYAWLAERGNLSTLRLYETFNMGIGFVLAIAPSEWNAVRLRLLRAGFSDSFVVGHVSHGSGVEIPPLRIRYEGYA